MEKYDNFLLRCEKEKVSRYIKRENAYSWMILINTVLILIFWFAIALGFPYEPVSKIILTSIALVQTVFLCVVLPLTSKHKHIETKTNKDKPILTDKEFWGLTFFDDWGYRYVARDANGILNVYDSKPTKGKHFYVGNDEERMLYLNDDRSFLEFVTFESGAVEIAPLVNDYLKKKV